MIEPGNIKINRLSDDTEMIISLSWFQSRDVKIWKLLKYYFSMSLFQIWLVVFYFYFKFFNIKSCCISKLTFKAFRIKILAF